MQHNQTQRNDVLCHLRDQQPNVLNRVCHPDNLAVKAAMKSLPNSLLVNINTHSYKTVKREDQLNEFCEFVNITYGKTGTNTPMSASLLVLVRAILVLPASNADSGR